MKIYLIFIGLSFSESSYTWKIYTLNGFLYTGAKQKKMKNKTNINLYIKMLQNMWYETALLKIWIRCLQALLDNNKIKTIMYYEWS